MKNLVVLIVAYLLLSCKNGESVQKDVSANQAIIAIELNTGVNGGFTTKTNQVITDEDELKKAWKIAFKNYMKVGDAPEVDFNKNVVLLVAMGEKNSGGYSIKVEKVVSSNLSTIVSVVETVPGKNCNVTSALTYPYQFVQIEKPKTEITFTNIEDAIDCVSE